METLFSSSIDVAVVGAGVVGLSAALAIQRARPDRRVLVVGDASSAEQMVTITPSSVDFLESLGVQVREHACAIHQMRVFSGSELTFDAADAGLPALAWVLNQSALQAQLEVLIGRQGISRVSKTLESLGTISPLKRRLLLQGPGFEISASLAIAADGSQSMLRTLAGIETQEYRYPQRAMVAQVEFARTQKENDCAYQWFGPHGVLALLPTKNQGFCMIWSAPERPEHDEMTSILARALDPQTDPRPLLGALSRVIGASFGEPRLASPIRSFPLARLKPKTLIAERVALVGDAAHVVHPLAGQGLNLGLADAQAISEVLRALPPAADVGEAIHLRRYARSRAEPIALMLNLTHALQKAFETPGDPGALERVWRAARELGWRGLNQLPTLKEAMIRHAS
jgi:2-polyprenylphenol 6-hydroxylase